MTGYAFVLAPFHPHKVPSLTSPLAWRMGTDTPTEHTSQQPNQTGA